MLQENTAKNFVIQLGSLVALYISIAALVTLLFGVINLAFPDDSYMSYQYDSAQSGIRFGIATLIVFFPAYLYLTRSVNSLRRRESGTYLALTKWLVYLSLLVGGGILLGDFVAVIMTYLEGEITTRFILKALALFIITGAAFVYYLMDAKGYWQEHEQKSITYGAGVTIVVVASLILGFYHSDTPREVRDMRLDDEQVNDLRSMQYQIESYYRTNNALPENLDAAYDNLERPSAPSERPAYTYQLISEDSYELCATFASATDPDREYSRAVPMIDKNENWAHSEGHYCFVRSLKPLPTE